MPRLPCCPLHDLAVTTSPCLSFPFPRGLLNSLELVLVEVCAVEGPQFQLGASHPGKHQVGMFGLCVPRHRPGASQAMMLRL